MSTDVQSATEDFTAPKFSLQNVTFRSIKRARDIFLADHGVAAPRHEDSRQAKLLCKVHDEYEAVKDLPPPSSAPKTSSGSKEGSSVPAFKPALKAITAGGASTTGSSSTKQNIQAPQTALARDETPTAKSVLALRAPTMPKPQWHPHWSLYRVISGHTGWVRCVATDPSNQWFVTGSNDRTIKIFDLASGTLKLTLTGHVSTPRGLAVSDRHPYMFSCGEDKEVKCWDLEQNKVIRNYHGHLSAVYGLAFHPVLDLIVTCGRDATVRLWDIRTKAQVHCMTGHTNTVAAVLANSFDPQVISGSHDNTVRLWDIREGKSYCTLTNHKKSIRALGLHPKEATFASGAADNIKQWYLPDGKFIQNLIGHNSIINAVSVNGDGVLVSGGDNGSMCFWDYRTGYKFQEFQSLPQPGSLDSEAGILCSTFDRSGSRLIVGEADKTIKIYKEDINSTPETHPVVWQPNIIRQKKF